MGDREARAETLIALLAIVLSGFFLFEGARLKPGVFEPIGPGAVPMGVAVVTMVLSAMVLFGRWRSANARPQQADVRPFDGPAPHETWALLLASAAMTAVYVLVLQSGAGRYGYVTVAYLLAMFLALSDQARKDLPWAVALALVFGLGLDYVFRHLLVADLP